MNKKTRLKLIISLSSVGALALGVFGFIYFSYLHHYKGKDVHYDWKETDPFDISSLPTVEKKSGEEFRILNFADIQICDLENMFNRDKVHKEMTYLVEQTKPHLITLTGDQTWSNENRYSLMNIISWLDDYKIPYAPVFGNHDFGNEGHVAVATPNYCCDLYENGKYSLFKRGPTNIDSLGNYVVRVMEDNKTYSLLYMVDSGANEKINDQQISYFKWIANGVKTAEGSVPKSFAFMHKPLPEYINAYYAYQDGVPGVEKRGEMYHYYYLGGSEQNGFFDFAQTINIDNIVAGHQHGNCFSIKYNGVWLTSSLKTGEFGGTIDNEKVYLNGASLFKLNNHSSELENIFVKKGQF